MTQEQIEKLQGNYKPFIGDILEPKQVSDSYKAAKHMQSAQKITTDTAKVTLDLPKDGVVVLTPAEYLKLVAKDQSKEIQQLKDKVVNLLRNLQIKGITIDGAEYLFKDEELSALHVIVAPNLSFDRPNIKVIITSR